MNIFLKSNKRPCICGCTFDDHAKIEFKDGKATIYYCRECPSQDTKRWCYSYTPIGNLEYMEWLYEQLR